MAELPFADLVPLWRTVREQQTTALITPALDYVGCLELATCDARFDSEEALAARGEALRSFVASLDDGVSLLFLYRVAFDVSDDVQAYEQLCADAEPMALRAYVEARAAWLRQRRLRRTRLYCFFSEGSSGVAALNRGTLGARLVFGDAEKLAEQGHRTKLDRLGQLRDRLVGRLAQLSLPAHELGLDEVWRVHSELLNPSASRQGLRPPRVNVRANLWEETTLGQHPFLREYTEAEQLVREPFDDARGHFRQGYLFRRCLSLKLLPESGTDYFASEHLLDLHVQRGPDSRPLAWTLAVAVNVLPQGRTRFFLDKRHQLVSVLKNAVPFLSGQRGVAEETADSAHQESIQGLFAELTSMSSKLVTVSVTVLLDGTSLQDLDAQTEAVQAAFNALGNSELQVEDVAQLPAFLSMLPGGGPYQLRKKGCTSRNAGDFLPVFAAWRGSARPASVLETPAGDLFRWDLFDPTLAAHHGLVVADTGSGKSVTLGALTLDALASGVEAILVDNGGSWRHLTELMGGTYLPVSLNSSICPFPSYEGLLDPKSGDLDQAELGRLVHFLDLCTADVGKDGLDLVQRDLVARVVRRLYDTAFRDRPGERPVISHFKDALETYGDTAEDQQLARSVARRLAIYCGGGLYGDFLNRPSELRLDKRLLTFDMAGVNDDPMAKKLAMATLMQAIGNRARTRGKRTLVEVDEGHRYIGTDAVAERFLADCYRTMRKHNVGMWMISQKLGDFANSKVGDAIVGNAPIKVFLQHGEDHHRVAQFFRFSPRTEAAFKRLQRRNGHYSDLLVLHGKATATVRLALHPLAYWILTTAPADTHLIERTAARNPALPRFEVLEALAAKFPHGAPEAARKRAGA